MQSAVNKILINEKGGRRSVALLGVCDQFLRFVICKKTNSLSAVDVGNLRRSLRAHSKQKMLTFAPHNQRCRLRDEQICGRSVLVDELLKNIKCIVEFAFALKRARVLMIILRARTRAYRKHVHPSGAKLRKRRVLVDFLHPRQHFTIQINNFNRKSACKINLQRKICSIYFEKRLNGERLRFEECRAIEKRNRRLSGVLIEEN